MSETQTELITIRPIEIVDDRPFLEQMAYLAAYATNGEIDNNAPPLEVVRKTGWFRELTANWGRKGDYGLIASDEDGQPMGGAWYRNYRDRRLPERLVALAVDPAHQTRKGVGTFLLQTLMSHASDQGIEELYLTVDMANDRARSLYEKLGFALLKEFNSVDLLRVSTGCTTTNNR